MGRPLDLLVGMQVTAAGVASDGAYLRFSGCVLSGYTPHTCSVPLNALVGATVTSVSCTTGAELRLGAFAKARGLHSRC
jgi:hypothetical protein